MSFSLDNQFLLTGKVVSLTGRIESRLSECGAFGNGLREKTISLGNKLSPEVIKLLTYIGSIRNRFAHEQDTEISEEEFAFFEEAVRVVLEELDIIDPKRRNLSLHDTSCSSALGNALDEQSNHITHSKMFVLAGRIPILHLAYAAYLLYLALKRGIYFLVLLISEVMGILLILWGILSSEIYLTGLGLFMLLITSCIGFGVKLRESGWVPSLCLFLVPGLNLVVFLLRLLPRIDKMMLLESFAIITIWVAAIAMVIQGEIMIAGVLAFLSYIGSVVASCVHSIKTQNDDTILPG